MYVNPLINRLAGFYNKIISIGNNLQSLFLFLLRMIWGHQLFLTGHSKFAHLDQTIQHFTTFGFSHPYFLALLTAIAQLVMGLCFFVGFASRLASIPLIALTISSLVVAHSHVFSNFNFVLDPAVLVHSAPFPFLMVSLIVFLFGPGRLSVDAWIKHRSEHWEQY